jgi:L-ascorbate metabolism protein UlaG (beta-lactamase superfamily)
LLPKEFDIHHAFLPIGDNFTMGVDDAIIAAEFIKCKSIIGMHYDTFSYVVIDTQDAKAKFESAGANLTLMEIGETIEI